MRAYIEAIRTAVTSWAEVEVAPHRFGGLEFTLGRVEIGHIHGNGMVDIPFNSKIRTQLLAEQKVEPHHLLPDTGWISFYIRSAGDVEQAIWLFRLSYLFNATRGEQRARLNGQVNVPQALAALKPSTALHDIFTHVTRLSGAT